MKTNSLPSPRQIRQALAPLRKPEPTQKPTPSGPIPAGYEDWDHYLEENPGGFSYEGERL